MPGVKSGRRIPAGRSRIIQVQLLRWKCGEGKSIIGYVAADPKGALPVFEGDRRYTSDVRADNIASVDTDCAETKTVPNGINRCKDPVCLSEPVRGCRVSASIRGRSIFNARKRSGEKISSGTGRGRSKLDV